MTTESSKWTAEDLENTLYKSDEDPAYNVIHEIKYVPIIVPIELKTEPSKSEGKEIKSDAAEIKGSISDSVPSSSKGGVQDPSKQAQEKNDNKEDTTRTRTEEKQNNANDEEGPPAVLDLDLSGGQIHVVEFYAPW